MYVYRDISWKVIIRFAWLNVLKFTIWASLVVFGFHWAEHVGVNLSIPFLPMSTMGIAVAFYLGFKNNASYDRFWEARKIWGGIVNYSRTWGNQVLSFVTRRKATDIISDGELAAVHKELIYRHIAWLYALKLNLRRKNSFQIKHNRSVSKAYAFGETLLEQWKKEVAPFIPKEEFEGYCKMANMPTQLIRTQGAKLRELMEDSGLIEDFRHMEMMRVQEEFYNLQGKCERIKNTPFPRQYAFFSKVFVWIFILLLPFGMVGAFADMGHSMVWLTVPFCVLVSWVFITMEKVGDNSEDPFENFVNDVPMSALCRTIEIDLLEMLGETDIPEKVKAVDGILL